MKITLINILLFQTLFVIAQQNDLFYKTVNSKSSSDSIRAEIIKLKTEFIEFSKPCYWESRDSLNIDYCNSHLIIFQDSNETFQKILITEFFIFREESNTNKPFEFFKWNSPELFKNDIRPTQSDLIKYPIDSSKQKVWGYSTYDTLTYNDSLMLSTIPGHYQNYTLGRDGLPKQEIGIYTKDTSRKITIDQNVFFPDNHYYKYNCKLPIYTLRILLEQEFQNLTESVHFHLEQKKYGLLDSLGRLDFKNHPDHFEKVYEEQINYWIKQAENELGNDWKLKKN